MHLHVPAGRGIVKRGRITGRCFSTVARGTIEVPPNVFGRQHLQHPIAIKTADPQHNGKIERFRLNLDSSIGVIGLPTELPIVVRQPSGRVLYRTSVSRLATPSIFSRKIRE
jgi:hypothetical protein